MTNLAKVTKIALPADEGRNLTELSSQITTSATQLQARGKIYNRGALTYSETFDSNRRRFAIKTIEWLTGKIAILRMIREFERRPAVQGPDFWRACLDVMRIDLETPKAQLERIPSKGPVIIVANHPHGMVDGMVLADLIGRQREDYRILTRSLLTGIDLEAANYLIPVPFPHEEDAQSKFIEMRKEAMKQLSAGGVIALFPSGSVAASETMFGPAIEAEWNVFTAKMIRKSGATVVPCFFTGSNSRLYQIANQISATLRQGLLLHEIVKSTGKPQAPIIGEPIDQADIDARIENPREFMAWLRDQTISLKET